jgi:hypothetical protein
MSLSVFPDSIEPNEFIFFNNSSNYSLSINYSDEFNFKSDNNQISIIYIIFVLIILGFISLITLVGNLLVILAVYTTKSLHTVTNSFIVSLAVADMLVPVFIQPLSIYTVIFSDWRFGHFICDLWLW